MLDNIFGGRTDTGHKVTHHGVKIVTGAPSKKRGWPVSVTNKSRDGSKSTKTSDWKYMIEEEDAVCPICQFKLDQKENKINCP